MEIEALLHRRDCAYGVTVPGPLPPEYVVWDGGVYYRYATVLCTGKAFYNLIYEMSDLRAIVKLVREGKRFFYAKG
jgi:hypothetical protein